MNKEPENREDKCYGSFGAITGMSLLIVWAANSINKEGAQRS